MKYALLFREGQEPILVSAEQVRDGLYSRTEEFVDPEHEFKVCFVKGARNNGGPYFRLYYSYEDYKRLFPDKATRYEIVANMRKSQESRWHKKWKNLMADFCDIEHCIKNQITKKWKFADAFNTKTSTCIEFQHSYIALDFEERNEFYSELGIKTVWLYNLPNANVCKDDQGYVEILEDNARGFFRISEKAGNLENNLVYIQVKSGLIYRVTKLHRRESSTENKSTIRYFIPSEVYTEEEFIGELKYNSLGMNHVSANNVEISKPIPQTLHALWKETYVWMDVENVETGDVICVNRNATGAMYRDFQSGCIKYKYVDGKYKGTDFRQKKEYHLSRRDENRPIWLLRSAKKL